MSTPEAPEPELELAPADEAPAREARRTRTRREAPASEVRAASSGRKPRKPRRDATPSRSPRNTQTRAALAQGVSGTIHSIAFAVAMVDQTDSAIIIEGEERLTNAIMLTADQNPRFKAWLERSLQGGAYLQLVAAVGAIAVPIAARHMRLPPALAFAATRNPRVVTPDTMPAEWAAAEPAPQVFTPGVLYQDEAGPYTVDEAGNVIPVEADAAGVAFPGGDGGA